MGEVREGEWKIGELGRLIQVVHIYIYIYLHDLEIRGWGFITLGRFRPTKRVGIYSYISNCMIKRLK